MQPINDAKVNEAIRQCRERCAHAKDLFAEIEGFFRELEATGEWQDAELENVETGILEMLFDILGRAMYPGEVVEQSAELTVCL